MKNNYVKENFSRPPDYLDGTQDELKSKIKILMNKLQITKKEKEILTKENQSLQQEILQMQSNLRCMVSGFANTIQITILIKYTSITFPMANELTNSIAEFYKCECFDIFFDVLTQELNMQGIVYFFQTAMMRIDKIINDYFSPLFKNIIDVGCLNTIEGPILNVLRKSFQSTIRVLISPFFFTTKMELQKLCNQLNVCLIQVLQNKICKILQNQKMWILLNNFQYYLNLIPLDKLSEIMFNCFISDPSLYFDIQSIGQRQQFNQTKNDPIDGFLKNKEECIILMPGVYKHQEQMAKSLVLSYSYQLENN